MRINPITFDGFIYSGWVCSKTFLGICRRKMLIEEKYPFSDTVKMKELSDRGFVLKVREKP